MPARNRAASTRSRRRTARRSLPGRSSPGILAGNTLATADYTIKNLDQTKDSAVQFGLSEVGEAHFPTEELGAERTGFAYHVLKPGRRQAFGHRHENAEEVYVVLEGAGRIRLDEDVHEICRHDAIRVSPPVARALEAGPEGLTVLVFGPRHEADGELLHDFWSD